MIFTYFFLPQIFFYGVSSLAAAILNARGSFASPMWTPVINNVVVSLVGVALIVLAGTGQTPETITPREVQLLGIGTTLGIVAADGGDVAVDAEGRLPVAAEVRPQAG